MCPCSRARAGAKVAVVVVRISPELVVALVVTATMAAEGRLEGQEASGMRLLRPRLVASAAVSHALCSLAHHLGTQPSLHQFAGRRRGGFRSFGVY
jgi:hypothetical protein